MLRVLSGGALTPNALPADGRAGCKTRRKRQNDVNMRFLRANSQLNSNLARCTVLYVENFEGRNSLHRYGFGGE